MGNGAGVEALPQPAHGRPYSLELTLPPLACVFLKGPTHRARGPLLLGREGDAAIKAGDRPRILPERTRKIAPRSAHECRKTRWIES